MTAYERPVRTRNDQNAQWSNVCSLHEPLNSCQCTSSKHFASIYDHVCCSLQTDDMHVATSHVICRLGALAQLKNVQRGNNKTILNNCHQLLQQFKLQHVPAADDALTNMNTQKTNCGKHAAAAAAAAAAPVTCHLTVLCMAANSRKIQALKICIWQMTQSPT